MIQFVDTLIANDVIRRADLKGVRTIAAVEPRYAASMPRRLNLEVVAALESLGITRLYEHQFQCIEAVLDGQDVVLVSPTASGKSLCFHLPVVSALVENKDDHALFLYPMKALAHDQLDAIKNLTKGLRRPHSVSSWPFDGDTPADDRKLLKDEPPNIVITNPDSLHYAMLAYNEQWTKFFRSLRFIVLDEAHEYRGYFGINVAFLMRRLLALCASLGTEPRIIVSSATIANPLEHAKNLTGRDMRLVSGDSAGRPTKHFIFVSPDYPDFQYENILLNKLANLAATCVSEGISALVFCPTRKFVERLHSRSRQEMRNRGLDPEAIAPYKAGYTADERRQIERGLKLGSILVVFSTNALEIGIDMGRLDLVVMVGFPDTVMSAWQRAGRAGRSVDKEAAVLLWASRSVIDQFYVNNIDLFMNKPLDRLAVNLSNEEVVRAHAPCAVFELGGAREWLDESILGEQLSAACASIDPDLRLMKLVRPERNVDLRSAFGQVHTIRSKDDKEIGTTSGDRLFSEVYNGAIYEHFGRSWRVVSQGPGVVNVEPNQLPHYTEPTRFWSIQVAEILRGRRWQGHRVLATAFWGKVEVTDTLTGYREYSERTNELVDQVSYPSALSNKFKTEALWLQVSSPDVTVLDQRYLGLHTLEHALRNTVPLAIPCDPYDVAGITLKEGQLGQPTFFLYDTVRGGIGISREAYSGLADILMSSRRILESDCCDSTCPRCLQLSRCGDRNQNLDKLTGRSLVADLLEAVQRLPETLDPATMTWG